MPSTVVIVSIIVVILIILVVMAFLFVGDGGSVDYKTINTVGSRGDEAQKTTLHSFRAREVDEGNLVIACPDDHRIRIISAQYGLGNMTQKVLPAVKLQCDNLKECTFDENSYNDVFGIDPAPGQYKYIWGNYTCAPVTQKTNVYALLDPPVSSSSWSCTIL